MKKLVDRASYALLMTLLFALPAFADDAAPAAAPAAAAAAPAAPPAISAGVMIAKVIWNIM